MSKRHLVVMELPEAKSIPILYHNHPWFKVPTSYLNIQIQGKIQAAISYSQSQYLSTVDLPNNGGVKGANSSSSQKSTYNVWPWRFNVPLYLWFYICKSCSYTESIEKNLFFQQILYTYMICVSGPCWSNVSHSVVSESL